jgi:CHAT domain-containing protein/Tfp pilus assembly protein PilF
VCAKNKNPILPEKLFTQLSNLPDDASRGTFFARHRGLLHADSVLRVVDRVVVQGRADTHRALGLAETAVFMARKLRRKQILGLSLRAKANALNLAGQNHLALEFHQQALTLFEKLRKEDEIGRTLSASLQPMILAGQYDRAFRAAERARKIFTRLNEPRRLARLDNNVGNIYHRQDRFEKALAHYERSFEQLLPFGDSEELTIALNNMAVCLISLNEFRRALATYERMKAHCDEHRLPLLRAQADYNIAYLYYLRGEYSRAMEMLQAARHQCELTGDVYHFALCHLDLSEIYLELNLSAEAGEAAREGCVRFRGLGMGYEEAKCLVNEAIALSHLGQVSRSLELFAKARAKFIRERNRVWPRLIDLYQALVLFGEGRYSESQRLSTRAAKFFDRSLLPGKAVLARLLLARIFLRTGELQIATRECASALERLSSVETPELRYQANFLMGEILEASGEHKTAYDSYQRAREALETLRGNLRVEELKISFLKNRLEVYERIVRICLNDSTRSRALEESFGYIERAKSRSLAELLQHHGQGPPAVAPGQSGSLRRIREMREELNWYYRCIEIEQLRAERPAAERIETLQKLALSHEKKLMRALREVSLGEPAAGRNVQFAVPSLEDVQACLPASAAIVEFFGLKEELIAAIVTHEQLEIIPVTTLSRVSHLLQMLHFQISKFRLDADYIRIFQEPLLRAAKSHLEELYTELLAPLRKSLRAEHLVIVPHGPLHYLPFHALFDGRAYLIDSFAISYAPSASVFRLCQQRPARTSGPPLILGVPDERAPFILDEVLSVANILPESDLLLGERATEKVLRERGCGSRLIHIATHGRFRQDNPLLSGIRLGGGYLNLYDLYQLKLETDLVTLSGCATGLSVVGAGDELLGLIRGLLYAGAQSVLLTLWDVHDRSTTEFMIEFYRRFQNGEGKAAALQSAMRNLRDRYPHPYYWAPFALMGKVFAP